MPTLGIIICTIGGVYKRRPKLRGRGDLACGRMRTGEEGCNIIETSDYDLTIDLLDNNIPNDTNVLLSLKAYYISDIS